MQIITKSPVETQKLAQKLSRYLRPGDIVALFGELGTGKTIFVKGLAKGLDVKNNKVSSPSFILERVYKGRVPLYHFDLYRLKNLKEIYDLIQGNLSGEAITAIEWAERAESILPKDYLAINLEFINDTTRKIKFKPIGSRYQDLITRFKGKAIKNKF